MVLFFDYFEFNITDTAKVINELHKLTVDIENDSKIDSKMGFTYNIKKALWIIGCFVTFKYNVGIFDVVEEKMNYNKIREDHKIENRMKEGGKKI